VNTIVLTPKVQAMMQPLLPQLSLLVFWGVQAHRLRNEMRFRLKYLHRLVQCSHFLRARGQKYLCLMEPVESGRRLSSQITDEL